MKSSSEHGIPITRGRLITVIFALAATLTVVSMAVIFHAGRLSTSAQNQMNSRLDAISQLRQWQSTMKDAETGQRGFLLTGDESYLQPYIQALKKLNGEMTGLQNLAQAENISKSSLDRMAEFQRQKLAELAETIRLKRANQNTEALDLVRSNKGKEFMDEIRVECEQMLQTAQADYNEAARRASTINLWRSVVFVAVTAVNLAFLTWAFRRISRQEWFQSGRAQLAERIAGDRTLEELGEITLRFLAEYLDAQAGALFIEDHGVFRRFATYAVPSPENLPEKFARGEGFVGQAAKDKRGFTVDEVPPDYLPVGSGLGRHRPRQLIIAPVMVDGEVNGVVELGFMRPTPAAVTELLEQVRGAVGVAFRAAQYRTRLQQLLAETQQQSEELQTQSEELRVSNEELTEQSQALKESQARLEQQQTELEQSNYQLEQQTQTLENQKDDLSRAKTELETQASIVEQASRYKSDFLANMSHELRTPLNSSLILAKLLSDNREGNLSAEQIKYAQTIQAAGNDLLTLINDVLDLSKVEAGKMDLKAETFEIADLLEGLNGMFQPLAASKGLAFHTSMAPGAPKTLQTDRRRLEQVLKNLLSNAIKFTEKGEVTVEIASPGRGNLAFVVRDTGIGIAGDQLKIIFEPFRQADSAADRRYGGTGLGLSISRELARLMGGSIHVRSQPGGGSTFTLVLPENYTGAKSAPAPSLFDTETARGIPGKTARPMAKNSHPADDREKLSGSSRVILIVEDDGVFAKILGDLAHEMDFQVLVAPTAEEALALAQQFRPSAIVLDILLPDDSGMLVLERLKADARTRHIPVHVVSGSDCSQPALAMGAVGYMLKPVNRDELATAFRKLEVRLAQKLRRVLVVEDDAVELDSLQKLLASREVETIGVRTAAECLANLKEATFDCMVLDLSLPDTSGFSLLETLNNEDGYSYPPVIVYTGRDLNTDEEQRLRKYSKSIIIKGAKSPERLLDEVTLFLHQVVSTLPQDKQQMLEKARSRESALEGRRILIAEDDVRNIFALTSLLEPRGAKIQIARNGREAVQAIEKAGPEAATRIDLVLMDIMMPEMNGYDAMRAIRKNPARERLPIIALTAKAMKDDQEKCLEAGANDYLPKPLDVEKLLSLIRVWMPR